MQNCELCAFKNPKATATAVIIRDNKVLLLKRNEEPFKGMWDFPGGYLNENEKPEVAIARELSEELGVMAEKIELIDTVNGTATWRLQHFPIVSFCYLVDIGGQEINLDTKENSEFAWVDLKELDSKNVAFNSNQLLADKIKWLFTIDFDRVKYLINELDSSAVVKEYNYYKAILEGTLAKIYEEGKLVGMGWYFPRQTLLRKQAVVEDMIVDNEYRGRGIGRKILQNLIELAKNEGIEVMELTTNPKRVAANELYKSEGFELHPTNHYLLKL